MYYFPFQIFVLKKSHLLLICFLSTGFFSLNSVIAQTNENLFTSENVLHLKLYSNFKTVQKDRNENPSYHLATLSYKNNDSIEVSIPLKIKVRGNFRKDRFNCVFPPLLLSFPKHHIDSTGLFMNQDKLKLVTHCQGDQYVIHEWLVYKLYNLITEQSFRARLVKVDYIDSSSKLKTDTHFGILIEDENAMAKRNGCFIVKRKMVASQATTHDEYLKMTVFQYMIGNNDWSIPYLHNIRLISPDTIKVPFTTVPYDFDHAGIVGAPYALPPPELELSSVRERLYRGYCLPYTDFAETVKLYNKLKDDIYKTYTNCSLLQPRYIKQTTAYLDDFYKILNNKKLRLYEFGKPCSPDGKQNILIKGLKGSD